MKKLQQVVHSYMMLLNLLNKLKFNLVMSAVDNRLRFIGQLEDVTKQAALQSFPKSNEREIEQAIAAALKNAADRMGGRQRRMKSKNNEPE
ncbi:hypothetical protein BOX15_Mlig015654g1 [Macrostomum lignano]|uniref:Uncharacterized protein n=1 Tax=Macrostomum lignano TaxID=282301 RepID=A0A267FY23_9PLAT|nr:hypothetical protein BOX15_Mlig015654g1 [Macrostomum lignano]